ncbi:MAG: TRAP transporter small permease [Oceanicoccus sp.]|uniref:TRAP transporter small permease subunit n=1 Tax=Oceanicoccus sp. TaxID=2691044 RepID=UPI002637AFE3|nr:TRAP transporter small permease [Oceanicoccus sp.]MCP3908965.1 TRAP transporter small permease [Oceanicoccus sp.]
MSASSAVLQDQSRLSRIDRIYFKLETVLTLSGGVVIFLLVFLASANVLGRWLFNMPISGYVDWVEQAMAFFAFLGLSYTQRIGGHIRMDMLVGSLKGRLLWISELLSVLLMFLVTLVLIYGSYLHFYRAFSIGDSSVDIDLPTWPAKLVVPIALSIFALRLLLQIWGYAKAVANGGDSPVAVPLIEDAAAVAAQEAESVMGSSSKGEGA